MAKYAGIRTKGHDSKFEWSAGIPLASLGIKKNKDFKMPYIVSHNYTPDYVFEPIKLIIETKGYFKPSDRKKMKAVKETHPNWRYILVFQNADNKLTGSQTRYWQWAEKNGFEWSSGGVTQNILNEIKKAIANEKR